MQALKIYIFNVLTITFDQFDESLLDKTIHLFFKNRTELILFNFIMFVVVNQLCVESLTEPAARLKLNPFIFQFRI